MKKLSKRLLALARLAGEGGCLADVGCDHGYLSIYLVEQGAFRRAIAMDVGAGPLERAKMHIKERGLSPYIETRRSVGLSALEKGEAQSIVIAGMGGALMTRILSRGASVIEEDTTLVLQPQSEIMEFRNYLAGRGFRLLEEEMVQEDGKFYPMMKITGLGYGTKENGFSSIELKYGPLLLRKKHSVLKEYLHCQQQKQEEIIKRLLVAAKEQKKEERTRQVYQELEEIRQALGGYEDGYGL